jgi:hypothetical protein
LLFIIRFRCCVPRIRISVRTFFFAGIDNIARIGIPEDTGILWVTGILWKAKAGSFAQ